MLRIDLSINYWKLLASNYIPKKDRISKVWKNLMNNLCNVMMNLNSPSNGLGGQLRPPPQQFNMPPAHTLAPYFAAHFGPHVMAAAQAASAASFSTTPVMTSPVNSGHGMNMSSGHLSSSGSSSGNSTGNSLGNNSSIASSTSTLSSPEAEMDKMNKGEKMTRSHQYKKVRKITSFL